MEKIDILAIGKAAKEAKDINNDVINATIGMFYDDNSNLALPIVAAELKLLDPQVVFRYGEVSGGTYFEKNLLEWIFKDELRLLEKKFKIKALATPGGSSALATAFASYGKTNDKVVVSDIRWSYDNFIKVNHKDVCEYKLFIDNKFNIDDLKSKLDQLSLTQETIMVVINDPCHNPTGYNLSLDEWCELVKLFNSYQKNKIVLIYDIAYLDFISNKEHLAEVYMQLVNLDSNVLPLVSFSGSKSLSLYGVRLGALIGLFHNQSQLEYFNNEAFKYALGNWSMAPSVGIEIFNNITSNSTNRKILISQINEMKKTLKARTNLFINEAKQVGLKHYPYNDGFYILIKSIDPVRDYQRLVAKGIYVIPLQLGLRVALCSVATNEVAGLAKRIEKIINQP